MQKSSFADDETEKIKKKKNKRQTKTMIVTVKPNDSVKARFVAKVALVTL